MRLGHAIALVGALVLLLVMAMDWYSTAQGDEARRIESITENPSGAQAGEVDRRLNEEARFVAEGEEKNAWQADALIDRILLGLMLAAIVLAVLAAVTRAAGAKPTKGLGPAGLAALVATAAAVGVAYRIIQEPGLDQATNVKAGALLALVALALIALGSAYALRVDDERRAMPELREGIERIDTFTVEDRLMTDVGGTIGVAVLSTPGMIAMMERNSAILSFENLPDGKATVGFEVCVRHVAAAAEGAECTVRSQLNEIVDGRKLRFEVEVTEGDRTIGVGTHERRVIDAGGPSTGS